MSLKSLPGWPGRNGEPGSAESCRTNTTGRDCARHSAYWGPRAKVAVFVDGCFWHGCPDHYRPVQKNAEFWAAKLSENQARDRASDAALMDNGWHVLRVWEHEDLTTAASRIADQVRARALAR